MKKNVHISFQEAEEWHIVFPCLQRKLHLANVVINYKILQKIFSWHVCFSVIVATLLLPVITQAQVPALKVNSYVNCPQVGYIEASTYLTGTSATQKNGSELVDNNGNTYIYGNVSGLGTFLGINNSNTINGGAVLVKLAPNGSPLWQKYLTPLGNTSYGWDCTVRGQNYVVENGYVYAMVYQNQLKNFPGLIGPGFITSSSGAGYVVVKVDAATGATVAEYAIVKATSGNYLSYYDATDFVAVKNGAIYAAYGTSDPTLPVTDGSSLPTGSSGMYVVKYDASGSIVYAGYKFVSTADNSGFSIRVADDGSCYVAFENAVDNSNINLHTTSDMLMGIDPSGNVMYTKQISTAQNYVKLEFDNNGSIYWTSQQYSVFNITTFAKVNALSGNIVYNKTLDFVVNGIDYSTAILCKIVGNYTYMVYADNNNKYRVVKVDMSTGNVVWQSQVPFSGRVLNYNTTNSPSFDVDASYPIEQPHIA